MIPIDGEWRNPHAIHICPLLPNAQSNDSTLAAFLNNLAALYRSDGGLLEAEAQLRRAIDIWERGRGPEHPDVAAALNNLGDLARRDELVSGGLNLVMGEGELDRGQARGRGRGRG